MPSSFFSCLFLFATTAISKETFQNISGLAGAGPSPRQQPDIFNFAARHPLLTNNVSFAPFNFSLDPAAIDIQNLTNTAATNWTWHLNLTTVDVTNITTLPPGDNKPQLVTNVVYDLAFPDYPSLPRQNETDWTLCGHFLFTPFPSNLTSRFSSETGDCSATLGQDCLAAYQQAFLRAQPDSPNSETSCPEPPFWGNIPECAREIGIRFSMVTSTLMTWTGPPIVTIPSKAFPDPLNRTTTYGLNSTQPIFWSSSQNYDGGADDAAEQSAYEDQYAAQMRMMILTFQPSKNYSDEAGHSGVSTVERQTRFLCQSIANGNHQSNSSSSSSSSSSSAAARSYHSTTDKSATLLSVSVAIAVLWAMSALS